MKRIVPFLALLILAVGVSFGISRWSHRVQPLPQVCSLGSLSDYLALSAEQRHELEPSFAELTKQRVDVLARRDAAVSRLLTMLQMKNTSKEQVDQALAAVDVEQARLRSLVAYHLLHLKSVLTDEQTVKLFDLVSRRMCLRNGQASSSSPMSKVNSSGDVLACPRDDCWAAESIQTRLGGLHRSPTEHALRVHGESIER